MQDKRWTLVAAILGSGIVFLDSTIVNVAMPKGALNDFYATCFIWPW